MPAMAVVSCVLVLPSAGADQPAADTHSQEFVLPSLSIVGERTGDETNVGILGPQKVIDTPVSVTSYTDAMILDQGAQSTSEVLANDPSVRLMGAGDGNYDNMMIRGFPVTSSAFSLNGLYGVLPWNTMSPEAVDQFEVIRGPSTALTGSSPFGAVGGAINIRPKRADDSPQTDLHLIYDIDGQSGAHVDVGRRFGADNAFGVRANVAHRDGGTMFDHQSERVSMAVLGLDYRGNDLRLSADVGYQSMYTDGATFAVFIEPGVTVPDPLDEGDNPFADWAFADSEDKYIALHGEYDLTPGIVAFASVGTRDHESAILNPYTDLDDVATRGRATVYPYHESYFADTKVSALAGIRSEFETGDIGHNLVLSGSFIRFDVGWVDTFFTDYVTDIANPTEVAKPDLDNVPSKVPTQIENRLSGISLVDTLSFYDDRIKATIGVRRETFDIDPVNDPASHYREDAWAPSFGLTYKVVPDVSLYANYMEGLSQGPIAPVGSANVGEVFAPTETQQYEIGVKHERDDLFTSLSFFQIEQPTGLTDPVSNVFSVAGEQRNRGIELTFAGEVDRGIRILGGAAYLDAELTKTDGGALDGKRAPGVAELTANLGAEWDLAAVPGLTLTGRVLYTGDQYVDAANTQQIDSWTRLDLGARYRMKAGTTPLTLRVNAINVTGEDYWASAASDTLTLGAPRSVMFSMTAEF